MARMEDSNIQQYFNSNRICTQCI